MDRACTQNGKSAFKILTDKHTLKRPLGRPRHKWEDNVGMNLKEIGINKRNWIESTHDRDYWIVLVKAALNLRLPQVIELISYIVKLYPTRVSTSTKRR